jgi:DNA polymerase-3 subunit delta
VLRLCLAVVSRSELKAVYLIGGTDRPKVERAVERLRGRFDGDAIERLSAAESGGEEAAAACNSLGLFASGGRLVLVDGVERWKAADVKAIADYLRSPAPDTVLALVADELKKDSALAKACQKVGEVLVYDVAKRSVPSWVAKEFARVGARADVDACRALVELVGDDLVDLSTEVGKLATWAGGDEIHEGDVLQLVAPRAGTPPFAITDAWGRRDVAAVLAACEIGLERGDGRTRSSLPAFVGRLYSHVSKVRACRELDDQGVRPRDAAAELKMHPFAAEKALAQSRNFSRDELDEAVVLLAGLDRATKGGSRLPDELELERTLVEITRPRQAPTHASGR